MINAINTVYKGYRFRSRLEARWAVFFDALGVKYEYEQEGYNLNGIYYLPDFWLPYPRELNFTGYEDAGEFVEIKKNKVEGEEIKKAQLLAQNSKHSVNIFYGLPGEQNWIKFHRSGNPFFYHKNVCVTNINLKNFVLGGSSYSCKQSLFGFISKFVTTNNSFEKAIKKAKQARFEHGEKP